MRVGGGGRDLGGARVQVLHGLFLVLITMPPCRTDVLPQLCAEGIQVVVKLRGGKWKAAEAAHTQRVVLRLLLPIRNLNA